MRSAVLEKITSARQRNGGARRYARASPAIPQGQIGQPIGEDGRFRRADDNDWSTQLTGREPRGDELAFRFVVYGLTVYQTYSVSYVWARLGSRRLRERSETFADR